MNTIKTIAQDLYDNLKPISLITGSHGSGKTQLMDELRDIRGKTLPSTRLKGISDILLNKHRVPVIDNLKKYLIHSIYDNESEVITIDDFHLNTYYEGCMEAWKIIEELSLLTGHKFVFTTMQTDIYQSFANLFIDKDYPLYALGPSARTSMKGQPILTERYKDNVPERDPFLNIQKLMCPEGDK